MSGQKNFAEDKLKQEKKLDGRNHYCQEQEFEKEQEYEKEHRKDLEQDFEEKQEQRQAQLAPVYSSCSGWSLFSESSCRSFSECSTADEELEAEDDDDAEEEAAEAPMEEAAGASYGAGASGAGGGLPDVKVTRTGRRSRRVCRGGISSPHCSRMSRC